MEATNSKGILNTGEVFNGERVQRFLLIGKLKPTIVRLA
jgi:hypothetical protein